MKCIKQWILWICYFFIISLYAKSPYPAHVDSLIRTGINQTVMMQFDSALATFDEIEIIFPNHMIGPFYRAATYQSMMMDFESDKWSGPFQENIQKAIDRGEEALIDHKNDAWLHFYLGSAYSYQGLFKAKSGSLISGFKNAHKGVGFLRKAVEIDSALYDAYLGIGNYMYWSGRFYKYLRWLPFIKDERKKGLKMLHRAVQKGNFSYWVALNSLGWIEYDRKNYKRAFFCFKQGLDRYPGSRFFLWGIASSFFKMEAWEEAISIYLTLLESIRKEPNNNGYNEIECRCKMMQAYYERETFEEAFFQAETILNLQVEPKISERLEDQYKKARKYKKKALKKMGGK